MPTGKPHYRRRSRAPSFVALAVLAGSLVPAPAFAAGAFDGTYGGPMQPKPGNHPGCTKQANASVTIRDSHLTYVHFNGNATIEAQVANDGSFEGQALNQYLRRPAMQQLKGKVSGKMIDAETSNPNCGFHLILRKRS